MSAAPTDSAVEALDAPSVSRPVAALAFGRWVTNVALRFPLSYLPAIARGAGLSLGAAGMVLSIQLLAGIPASWLGGRSDRLGYRNTMVAGLTIVAGGAAVVALGGAWWFGIGFALIGFGKPLYDLAMISWIGAVVPFERRGRVIGATEFAWALSLLVGTPVIGLVIDAWSWREAFVVTAVAALVAVVVVRVAVPRAERVSAPSADLGPLPSTVLPAMVVLGLASGSHQLVMVAHGIWMEEQLGLSVEGVGVAVVVLGLGELLGTAAVTAWADRLGSRRTALIGLIALAPLFAALPLAGEDRVIGLGLLTAGVVAFEIGFIALMVMITELSVERRAEVVGWAGITLTAGRAVTSVGATTLWAAGGIAAISVAASVLAVAAAFCLAARVASD